MHIFQKNHSIDHSIEPLSFLKTLLSQSISYICKLPFDILLTHVVAVKKNPPMKEKHITLI